MTGDERAAWLTDQTRRLNPHMSDKPRTWTLEQGEPGNDIVASGGPEIYVEDVPVIELEPVLDLLEPLIEAAYSESGYPRASVTQPAEAILREHGRFK